MSKVLNQDIERYYFEKFRNDFSLPSGTVIYGDSPDVVIVGERKIGIEITNFYHKPGSLTESEQIQNRWREKVVLEAQNLYEKGNRKKFEISFGFDKSYPIWNQKSLIDKIIHLAKNIENFQTGQIGRNYFDNIPELSYIYLYNQETEYNRWRIVQVYDVPMLDMKRLVDIIREKESRSQKYEKCDAYWLLIVIDTMNPAQDQDILVNNFEKVETEVFERVIVYKSLFGQVFEAK